MTHVPETDYQRCASMGQKAVIGNLTPKSRPAKLDMVTRETCV